MRQDSGQFNKLRVILKERKQISRNCIWRKKIVIFAAPIIYMNYTVDGLLKTVELKKYLAINFKNLAYQWKFISCLICLFSLSTWICIVALKPLRFDQTICIACAWRPWVILTVAFAQNGAVQTLIDKFQHESSVFAGRLSRGQSKLLFKLKLRDRSIKVLS